MYPKGDDVEDTSNVSNRTIPKITALLIIYLFVVVIAFILFIGYFAKKFFGIGVKEDL